MLIKPISYVDLTNSGIFYDCFRPPPTFRHHNFLTFISSGQIVRTSLFVSVSSPARVVIRFVFLPSAAAASSLFLTQKVCSSRFRNLLTTRVVFFSAVRLDFGAREPSIFVRQRPDRFMAT